MARPSSYGTEYMIRPHNAGPYIYRRTLCAEIVPYFHGELNLEWSASTRKLASPGILKISLKTGDEKTAGRVPRSGVASALGDVERRP